MCGFFYVNHLLSHAHMTIIFCVLDFILRMNCQKISLKFYFLMPLQKKSISWHVSDEQVFHFDKTLENRMASMKNFRFPF